MASTASTDLSRSDGPAYKDMDGNSTACKLIYYQHFREAGYRQIKEINAASYQRPLMVHWRTLDAQQQEQIMSKMLRSVAFQPDFDLNDVECQNRVMSSNFIGELTRSMRKKEKKEMKKRTAPPKGNPLLRLAIEQSASLRQASIM